MENFEKPTDEQIAVYEAKMKVHYEKNLPFLRLKAEFDMLQADIAEARMRILSANSQFGQAMVAQSEAEADAKKEKTEVEKKAAE